MNEETFIERRPVKNGQNESKQEDGAWKHVTLGGVSGILMGAGLVYAGQTLAEGPSGENASDGLADNQPAEGGVNVAQPHNDLSFGEAFAAARAEVGPGGVFHWHGGIYNTYTADEWNAMSHEQKQEFAQQVKPEISANEVHTPTDANTHIVVEHHVYHHDSNPSANEAQKTDDVQVVSEKAADADSDVHIVGYGEVKGHAAVGIDMDGDGQADVAIIDIDDNQRLSDPDIVVDKEGNDRPGDSS